MTSGATSGDQPQLRSLHAPYTTRRDNIIFFPTSRPSERQAPQPNCQRHSVVAGDFIPDPIDHREFGSWAFTIAFFAAPSVIVTLGVVGYAVYALLVAQPVEY